MNKFDRFMSTTALIFVAIIAIAFVMINSYMRQHDIRFKDVLKNGFVITSGNSSFNTYTLEESDTYSVTPIIKIKCDLEDIRFIKEDRNDIQVDYYRVVPDSPLYKVDYKVKSSNDTLDINVSTVMNGFHFNNNYEGEITIRVPMDYRCEELHIRSSLGNLSNEDIYEATDSLYVEVDLGNVELDIESPKDVLELKCNLGDLKLNLYGKVNTLKIEANLGSVKLSSSKAIEQLTIDANMGQVIGTFKDYVGYVNAETNMGNLELTFYENDDSLVYGKSDMGSFHSDLETTNNRSKAQIVATANMGKVEIRDNK